MAFCSNCGAKQGENEKFCGECGYGSGQPTAPAQAAQPPQQAVCPNCGTLYSESEKFCGECGYTTGKQAAPAQAAQPPQQQAVAPAPPPVQQPRAPADKGKEKKKKSKAPIIIIIVVLIVAALAAAVYFTNGFGLFSRGDKPNGSGEIPTVSSGIKVNKPSGASEDVRAAYEYIQGAIMAFECGMEYDAIGLTRPAESIYGTAASTICALRYAADCLLGEESDPAEWDKIAAMGWGTPAAYFFEGLVNEAQGKADKAADCYAKAAVNPAFTDGDDLKGIASINGDDLRRLRDEAARVEGEIFKLYEPVYSSIPRHEKNYDPVFLAEQAAVCLNGDNPDLPGALAYYRAALSVNPFGGYNYAGIVMVYIAMGDGEAANDYLTEGLTIDPENKTLNALISKLEEVAK